MDFVTNATLANTTVSNAGDSSLQLNLPAIAAALQHNMLSVRVHVNTYLNDHYWLTVLFAVVLAGAVVVGVIGNIMVIIAVVIDKFLWQPANLLVINMAVADIVIAGVLDPFNIVGVVYGYSFFQHREWLCVLVGSICAPVCTASLFNYALIAINRYVRICKPHRYAAIYTWRNTILMCILIWIYGEVMHLPNHVGWGYTDYDATYYICTFGIRSYSYVVFWIVMTVLFPFTIVAVMYCLIFITVHKSNLRISAHKIAPGSLKLDSITTTPYSTKKHGMSFALKSMSRVHPDRITTSVHTAGRGGVKQAHESSTTVDGQRDRDELKLMRTLFVIIVVFLLCWILFVLLTIMGSPDWVPGWLFVLSIFTAHVQCALNPIVYCITNSNFRNAFKRIICLRFSQ